MVIDATSLTSMSKGVTPIILPITAVDVVLMANVMFSQAIR